MLVTYYKRPNGEKSEIDMTHILSEDEQWFIENKVTISLENNGGSGTIVYADIGLRTEDGEPDEMIEFSEGRDCKTTMRSMRIRCEKAMREKAMREMKERRLKNV